MDKVGGSQDWTKSAAARIGKSWRQPGLNRGGGGSSQDWTKSAAARINRGGGGSQDWTESAAAALARIGQIRRRRQPGLERVVDGGSQDWTESAAAARRGKQALMTS